jgi:hypothetical protein
MSNDTSTSTSAEHYLRTVRAVRASVEPTPPPYAESVSFYSQRAATEHEARRRAEQRARAWRSAYLLTLATVLVLAGGERQSVVMVAAGVVLVVVAVLSSQQEG